MGILHTPSALSRKTWKPLNWHSVWYDSRATWWTRFQQIFWCLVSSSGTEALNSETCVLRKRFSRTSLSWSVLYMSLITEANDFFLASTLLINILFWRFKGTPTVETKHSSQNLHGFPSSWKIPIWCQFKTFENKALALFFISGVHSFSTQRVHIFLITSKMSWSYVLRSYFSLFFFPCFPFLSISCIFLSLEMFFLALLPVSFCIFYFFLLFIHLYMKGLYWWTEYLYNQNPKNITFSLFSNTNKLLSVHHFAQTAMFL